MVNVQALVDEQGEDDTRLFQLMTFSSIAHQGVNRVKRRKQHAYRSANYQRER